MEAEEGRALGRIVVLISLRTRESKDGERMTSRINQIVAGTALAFALGKQDVLLDMALSV